jgi:uncharacterized protein YbcI
LKFNRPSAPVIVSSATAKARTISFYFRNGYHPPLKTRGEIESAICEAISRFEQEHMGRGPQAIHTHLIGALLVVRLQGMLTAAEKHLVEALPAEKGRDLLKQVRSHLIETARPFLEAMMLEVAGLTVVSMHHDISTVTGEKIIVFTLTEPPLTREPARK